MRMSRFLLVMLGVIALSACGPPVLDTTGGAELYASLEKLENRLEPERRQSLRDSIDYLTNHALAGDDLVPVETVLEAFRDLDGMTAEEIIVLAWTTEVGLLKEKTDELESRRVAGARAQSVLDNIEIGNIMLYPKTGENLRYSMVEVSLRNRTSSTVFMISFQVSLRRANESEPFVAEVAERPVGLGLEPGRAVTLRTDLTDPSWNLAATAGQDAVLLCGVVGIQGRQGRNIASTDYGPTDRYRHQLLQDQLLRLLAAQPPEATTR